MKKRGCILCVIILLALLAGCTQPGFPEPGELFEFPTETWPEEISFVMEHETYPIRFSRISAILTNATEPIDERHITVNYALYPGFGFTLVKQTKQGWGVIEFPDPGVAEIRLIVQQPLRFGEVVSYAFLYSYDSAAPIRPPHTNGRGLAPGIYRIVTGARLMRSTVTRGYPEMTRSTELVWDGPVWTEFEIVG
ncbi:MAG: hypothetical protein FWE06_05980 [Oscillospiraceae bacterium]|nr:hypothetical protein [Oscillospiraceae bacterium]